MGLLDQVLSQVLAPQQTTGAGPARSGIAGVLMNILSGAGRSGGTGGLGGLLSGFQQAGLDHIAQSWIGNGPNQPVSPQQLQNVFGDDQVHTMARQAGMAPHDFLSQPNGQLPDEGTVSV